MSFLCVGGLWGQAWEDHTCTLCPVNTDFLVQEGNTGGVETGDSNEKFK